MQTRRLEFLVELARLGSMRLVADELDTTTSTVSQQIAKLAHELGVALVEPSGRRVRLTPAGLRLASAAVGILDLVEAARCDIASEGEPVGTVRVAGFVTAIRALVLPALPGLTSRHPELQIILREHEPDESLAMLARDEIDLALTYDYNLAPTEIGPGLMRTELGSTRWGLAVPSADASLGVADSTRELAARLTSGQVFAGFRNHDWIGNSRNRADEDVVRLIASGAGFAPQFAHKVDSLDLVEDLIRNGLGVGLLPSTRQSPEGVTLLALDDPVIELRTYADFRRSNETWPPLSALLSALDRRQEPRG